MNPSSPIKDWSPDALRARFSQQGLAAYRADQVLGWLYRKGVEDFDAMTDLGGELREGLRERYALRSLEVVAVQRSSDATRKLALRTGRGDLIEAVVIPEERRTTLCISTQVGCPLACSFCATGEMGFTRNLSTAEIVDQVCRARDVLEGDERITNVVFMGMGEPLLNWPRVAEAIRTLVHPKGFGLAPRRLTISTAGLVPRIHDLLELAPVNLAVSLHATTDAVRDVLVPLNRRFPLAALLGALRSDPLVNRRRPVFFEYTLLAGVNDSLEDARRLPDLLRGIPSKLNVIPMNPHTGSRYRAPSRDTVDRFAETAHAGGLRVTVRRDRGTDIDAACGQLAGQAG